MPTIAFGTGSKWKGQVRKEAAPASTMLIAFSQDVTDYVAEAIEAGFSHIDTAQCELSRCSRRTPR